jgi:hypothetical protein
MANCTFLPPMATVYVIALPELYMTATRRPSGFFQASASRPVVPSTVAPAVEPEKQ